MAHQTFDVRGMTCAACQAHVDRAVGNLEGVSNVAVNLLAGSMAVDYDEDAVDADAICAAVDRAGYAASPVEAGSNAGTGASAAAPRLESPTKKLEAQARAMRGRLMVSIAFLIPLFYLGMGHMLGWPLPAFFGAPENIMNVALTELLLLAPIVYVNDSYFINGFKSLIHGAPTMDALIAIGSAVDVNEEKINSLLEGNIPIYEPEIGRAHV